MITTTLRQLRRHSPCRKGWNTLLSSLGKTEADDDPLPLVTILQSNGLDDTLWCLRTLEGHDKEIIRFTLACAQEVKHLMTDQRSLDVLSALERHLESPLSERELDKVLAAAEAARAAVAAPWAAWPAVAAAWAARATVAAPWAAAVVARATAVGAEAAAESTGVAESAAEKAGPRKAAAWAAARARQVQIFEGIFG